MTAMVTTTTAAVVLLIFGCHPVHPCVSCSENLYSSFAARKVIPAFQLVKATLVP